MKRSELFRLAKSQDYPQTTVELHKPNDFYGHASHIKRYAGLDPAKPLRAVIKHGTWFGDNDWTADLDSPQPVYIDFSSYRLPQVRERTPKALFSIGSYIHYAPDLLSPEETARERERLGRTLLVFPAHSTHFIDTDFDLRALDAEVARLAPDFDTVRICLYWKDILKNAADHWIGKGYDCVCAGHIFEPEFLIRLRSLIATADVTMSNIMSTHVGYCAYFGKPHYLFRQNQQLTNVKHNTLDLNQSTMQSPEARQIEEAFAGYSDTLEPKQRAVAARYFGLDEVRSPEWLRLLFSLAEEMARRPGEFFGGQGVAQVEMGLACQRQGRLGEALFMFEAAAVVYPELPDLHYLRAHCLAGLGRRKEAMAALEELFKASPGHAGGKALMREMVKQGG